MNENFEIIDSVTPSDWVPDVSMIKVIGIGGGGCNAVTYMYNQKVKGCNFIVCNTDAQALQKSNVPIKIQLGEGLGAGTNPTEGRNAALESQDAIAEKLLTPETKMIFITAGMGGGTGTGASPVIAKMAKDKGILTVAVVTLPFKNEGDDTISKAIDGIHELEHNVDSLLIINNEKLYEFYGNQLVHEAFPHADEVLATAVRGITEIISRTGYVNVDFKDVRNMMKNSGMALMGCGIGTGPDRLNMAVRGALESPLLNDFDLKTSQNLLVNITCGANDQGLKMDDLKAISDLIAEHTGGTRKFKQGLVYDENPEVGDKIQITVIATGFKMNLIGITGTDLGKLILIDKDFEYKPEETPRGEEISLPDEDIETIKVGYSTTDNVRKFNFVPDKKPVLILPPGQSKSELEEIAAIRRAPRRRTEDE
ncbi:MAG: cell division protein FtsZ [Bacteroidales bacterium]|nr:cell division protein FtsZ [Bacteroidales bacterium]